MFETVLQDIRYGARTLRKNPGFTIVAVVTLALGIGANTTIFSLTNQLLLRRLPVAHPEQLVVLKSPGPKWGRTSSDGDSDQSFSYPLYKDLRDHGSEIAELFACFPVSINISGRGETERASGELVSGNYFQVLGVTPAIGRVFSPDDETAPGANPVAVLSFAYWSKHFGSDASILNKTLAVNGTSLTVVGVARSGFTGVQVGRLPDVFIPITMKPQMTPNWNGLDNARDYWLPILGRLGPGFKPARAQAALLPTYRAILESEVPQMKLSSKDRQRWVAKPILLDPGSQGRLVLQRDVKGPLTILMAMVALVLLIACANLASLLLARGAARQREIALRLALGAGRWRLVRQLLTESFLLALTGGFLGILLGLWTLKALVATIPSSYGARGLDPHLDGTVLAFAVGVSILTGVLFGLAPALRATRASLQNTLKEQGSSVSEGLSNIRLRKGLIVSQIAVTTVLLVGASLFARSLESLKNVDLGLKPNHVIEFSVSPELNRYSPLQAIALTDQVRRAIALLPGVRSVSAAELPLLANDDSSSNITVEGYTPEQHEDMNIWTNFIGPDFFSTMGIPLMAGREFRDSDAAGGAKVAIVNDKFADRFFPHGNAVGSHFAFGAGNNVHPDIEIVGVVKESKHSEVREKPKPFAYMPYAQDKTLGEATFYVRTDQDPAGLATTLRQTVAKSDGNLPVYDLKTLNAQVNDLLYGDWFVAALSVCFALLASLLAAVGLYGVMAYTVARRTRELGIRMALGATGGNVVWLVLGEVIRMAGIGLAAGAVAAFFLGKFVEAMLYGVKAKDPAAFVVAIALLAAVALFAGYSPARRAAGVDPMEALRYE